MKAYAAVIDTMEEACVTVGYYDNAVAAGVAAVIASFGRCDVIRQYVAYVGDDTELVIVDVDELI